MAFLCGTLYLAAGIDVAMVLAPRHVALLIWLPEYPNANYYWDIPDDGREYGWIWIEATGNRNPVGWTPPDFSDGNWDAILLGFKELRVERTPQNPQAEDDVQIIAHVISARTGIAKVSLLYSLGTAFSEVEMQQAGTVYQAMIPKQPEGTRVQYFVTAIDDEGLSTETEKSEYVVGQQFPFPFPPNLLELAVLAGIIIILLLITLAIVKLGT
jgi:hypothetical protein